MAGPANNATVGEINGIHLPANFGNLLGGSPEDAAKRFMRAATQGLAQVMVSALEQAVGQAVGNGVGAPPDWTKFVRNFALNLNWESPPGTKLQTVNAIAKAGGVGGSLGGLEFGGCIRGTF